MPARLQYGKPVTNAELLERAYKVGASLHGSSPDPGVTVEFITSDPYTNVLGVVTAVGFKYDTVLLTVEPKDQPDEAERISKLAAILREIDGDHTTGAASLAEALVKRGVLPTRDW